MLRPEGGMTDRYLNWLYREYFSASPRAVEMELPAGLGEGRVSQLVTRQGTALSRWQMRCDSQVRGHGASSEAYVQLLFCLREGVSWELGDGRSARMGRGEFCLYRGFGRTEHVEYEAKRDFLFQGIKIPVGCFCRFLEDYFEEKERGSCERMLEQGAATAAITPRMERLLGELGDFWQYQGGPGRLLLESKICELLALSLGGVLELPPLSPGSPVLSRSDQASVREAKQIIDRQLDFAPGCEELARRVNISTSKLAKCFSSMYGTSIHAYIIDQRLERAAGLLLETNLSVGQVAALVGYSKASNFAAAFKKKYGVVPKRYRAGERG